MANPGPQTITIAPVAPHSHSHTVIFLHGRGDNTDSFTRFLRTWHDSRGRTLFQTFPTFRWVFPQAPLRPIANTAARLPRYMFQWFDVWNVQDFAEREEIQLEGLREMVPFIRELIRTEAEKLGARWDRVVLAGISMGAATSVHTLFNLEVPADGGGRLAGFLGFCARCPFAGRELRGMREVLALGEGWPKGDESEVLRRTPILLQHCTDDPLVKVENGRRLRDTLREFGAQVEWKEYPVGGHWFTEPEGIDDVVQFLNQVLGNGGPETAGASGQTGQAGSDAMDLS
ncbi:Alpha/Beta hydrolase protein [Achaetomium macrosporum]|uniref:Alpha/Beta hydrolase protein n=1 Tax=Achaetomium macrosporum TaxID=79813 RepID=A0AAN7C432_9PEZI|nr:Alpha/Beta hydrolase protein [Achaetomium macrosporum]